MKKIKFCMLVITISVLVASCKKDDNPTTSVPKVTTGLYVLSEGTFNGNNTTLTYYNFATSAATTDFFANTNGSKLGDTGNDIIIYGGKVYIVMNVSSYVEVADALTAKEIKKIPFTTAASVPREPRYAVGYKNKVLVSSYDGTVAVIDTTSLAIEKFITVGSNPEQVAVYGTNLYVANSGGLSPVYDSTVSVVDLGSFTETKKITVGLNPSSVVADDAGNIYVGCTGDYNAVGPKLVKVNTTTGTVTKSADTAVGKIRFYNGLLFVTGGYLGSSFVRKLSTTDFSQTNANFVTDGTAIKQPYGLNIDTGTGDVYVTDAVDYFSSGQVFCFDKTGKKKFSFSVSPGISPNTVVIIKQ
jgi:YVTN family beta-propeller protein